MARPHRIVMLVGFLAVDVLARPGRQHGQKALSVVGSRDQHRVDIVALDHLPEVVKGGHTTVLAGPEPFLVVLLDPLLRSLGPRSLHVADRQHLDIVSSQVAAGQIRPRAAEQMPAALPSQSGESHPIRSLGGTSPWRPNTCAGNTTGAATAVNAPRLRRSTSRRVSFEVAYYFGIEQLRTGK
jgi:hypothetical protein